MTSEDLAKLSKYEGDITQFAVRLKTDLLSMQKSDWVVLANEMLSITSRMRSLVEEDVKNFMVQE